MCLVLNYEENLKSSGLQTRVFFNINIVVEELFGPNGDIVKLYQKFSYGVKLFMKKFPGQENFKKVELVFFPIFYDNHYYLVVFDLKRSEVHVLDNRKGYPDDYYLLVPTKMVTIISKYLIQIGHPSGVKIGKVLPKYPTLKWKTQSNDFDCAIFMIRHMETFNGGLMSKYDAGFMAESEEQKKQLIKLRKKYLTKIVLCDINKNKPVVLQEAYAFPRKPVEERKAILSTAFATRHTRLDQ